MTSENPIDQEQLKEAERHGKVKIIAKLLILETKLANTTPEVIDASSKLLKLVKSERRRKELLNRAAPTKDQSPDS